MEGQESANAIPPRVEQTAAKRTDTYEIRVLRRSASKCVS